MLAHLHRGLARERTYSHKTLADKSPCLQVRAVLFASHYIYWQALYKRLNICGYEVCRVHCQAVRNNRKTMQDGTSKLDPHLLEGTCHHPVHRRCR